MQEKIRQEYELNVPRDLVHAVMYDLDPGGLKVHDVGAKKGNRKDISLLKGRTLSTQLTVTISSWGIRIV